VPLTNEQKEILKSFQTDHIRLIEEQFAQILTERSDVRLFFINENRCFTDGKNITIDPAEKELFVDNAALLKAEKHLNMSNVISSHPLVALQMNTRSANIHEALHIIYTNFPPLFLNDKRVNSEIRLLVLSDIRNIIEDAFIEAAGCSLYDNLESYLLWNRIALFYSKTEFPDTLEQKFEQVGIKIDTKEAYENIENQNETKNAENDANEKFAKLVVYLNYMGCFVLYPFFEMQPAPEPVFEYVEKTKPLFLEAALCGNANERDEYTLKIFDIIEPLLPDDQNLNLPDSVKYLFDEMKANSSNNASLYNNPQTGKAVTVTRRLFTDENGEPVSPESSKQKLEHDIKTFLEEKEKSSSLQSNEPSVTEYNSDDFDCSNLHRNIRLKVVKPKINRNLKKAYQNMAAKYRLTINSYSSHLAQYLKANVEEKEDKRLFGSGISSKYFGDTKKRFWHKKIINKGIPDVGFLFMVDGSGSMEGERLKGVMAAMIIIHEVLYNNNIQHSIIEHRAIYDEYNLIHNILVDFTCKNDEKYNILGLKADEGTREGFSLYWAERHINKNCSSEYKIIVMISDGAPAHTNEDPIDYIPPLSIKDTATAAKKIIKRGIPIIALALDLPDDDICYQQLKMIYPDVVSCQDVSKLTGQLLHLISRILQGRMK
jgi:hypothetical protein